MNTPIAQTVEAPASIEYVGSEHAPLVAFAESCNTLRGFRVTSYKADAIEIGTLNADVIGHPELYVSMGQAYADELEETGVKDALIQADGKRNYDNYVNMAKRAIVAVIGGGLTAKYIAKCTLPLLAEDGMRVLETKGQDNGFVAGYEPSDRRKETLKKVHGQHPETGKPMTDAEKFEVAKADAEQIARQEIADARDDLDEAVALTKAEAEASNVSSMPVNAENKAQIANYRQRADAAAIAPIPAKTADRKTMIQDLQLLVAESLGFIPDTKM